MEMKKLKTAELRPAPYNPRKKLRPGDKEYEKLKASITEFGYVDPVIVNERTGYVVGGHQRLQVLIDLGYTEVDCVVLDLPDAKEKALNVALNKIAGAWDIKLLKDLLLDIDASGFDLNGARSGVLRCHYQTMGNVDGPNGPTGGGELIWGTGQDRRPSLRR